VHWAPRGLVKITKKASTTLERVNHDLPNFLSDKTPKGIVQFDAWQLIKERKGSLLALKH